MPSPAQPKIALGSRLLVLHSKNTTCVATYANRFVGQVGTAKSYHYNTGVLTKFENHEGWVLIEWDQMQF